MKFLPCLLCLFFFFACSAFLAAQASKTVHQTFMLDGAQKVNINVVGTKVEIRETKGSRVLVEMSIKLSVPNERLLDYVINNGRYDLLHELNNATGELTITSPRTNNVLLVKGQECYEDLTYVIYLPAAVKFANNSTIENSRD